ncbi:DUF4118 domain-containing protein [Dactylosporangium sp. NPDC005572]|uniref:DUF4118 domain-containing protein n=1 Tax=Dactylosporangium sp. NPDC005572 TaxID=3156889 RepID=UPI0033AD736F
MLIVVETLLVYPLRAVMAPFYPGMIYIVGVLVASMGWGMWLGMATAVVSTVAFVFFHVQPVGRFAVSDIRQVVGLAVLLIVAVATSAVADLSRLRTAQAEESDLIAEMARLLHADDLPAVLPAVAQRIAQSLELPDAAIHLAVVPSDDQHSAFVLRAGAAPLGTLVVPGDVPERTMQRLRECVVPALASLLHAGRERAAVLDSLEASREHLRRLADEQAALGRVAKLVADGGRPPQVFDAITTELHGLLGEHYSTWLCRFESDATASLVSTSLSGLSEDQMRLPLEGNNVAALVWDTGRAARMDTFDNAAGPIGALARELGVRSVVGAPIAVKGRLWGAAGVGSTRPEPLPPDTEARVAAFVGLAATAIANADSQAELAASRARLVAAADQARQRIERNLHDSALQHFLAVAMQFATVQASLPPELGQTKAELSSALCGLKSAVDELREISRGIHPALLAAGGLAPALKALVRSSPVPVDLDLHTCPRMPLVVETAAYHVVSEALTNVARHAHASMVHVQAATDRAALHLSIRDDGVGGAQQHRGTGLTGLQDRVEALGGHLTITSLASSGTLLQATIPTTSTPCVPPE